MKSLIAVITYRRLPALLTMMDGLQKHCPQYSTAVFEDCGQRDGTADWLQRGRKPVARPEYMATEYRVDEDTDLAAVNVPNADVFMGERNLGVAGNSNRAIRHFLSGDWDHLCLCNDDLHVDGDFVSVYAKAHRDLEVGMFCFTDFPGETYKFTVVPWRGYKVKLMSRFTGIMVSVTRKLIEEIGGFDPEFGKFGEEHCDFTIRARLAGGISLNKQPMNCLDIEHPALRHQEVETSVVGPMRQRADKEASQIMQQCSRSYANRHHHREPLLFVPRSAGGPLGRGVTYANLRASGYRFADGLV